MNARLCFILKYVLLRRTLYRGDNVYSESLFSRTTNCFYPIITMLNVIRTEPWHYWCTPSAPLVLTLGTLTAKNQCAVCKWKLVINYLLVPISGNVSPIFRQCGGCRCSACRIATGESRQALPCGQPVPETLRGRVGGYSGTLFFGDRSSGTAYDTASLFSRRTTFSTCGVCGNISTGWTAATL